MSPESTRRETGQGLRALLTTVSRSLSKPETWTWLLVAVGVLFRLGEYARNRPLYMDEESLLRNLVGLPVFDLSTPLIEYQLAPPGFLILERVMVRVSLAPVWAARLIPLVCAIAAMLLMRSVARRYLSSRGVPVAVGLFAWNDWLIYYSTELKQYSSDTMLTLIALLLVSGPEEMTRRRWLALAALGLVGVWFSHPLALVLGAVGTYLAGKAALRHDWKLVSENLVMSLLWAVSFGICYFVSHRILSKERFIWDWWHFAFLPIPPRSLADLERVWWHVLNLFHSPAWVLMPLGILASALVACTLYVIGAIALFRRWPGGLYLLMVPLAFTLVASGLRQYPFHGRLLLFLVPTVHLLVAEGAAALVRHRGPILTAALTLFLLIEPARSAVWNTFVVSRIHGLYDSHGDLFPDLLDSRERPRIGNPSNGPKAPPDR